MNNLPIGKIVQLTTNFLGVPTLTKYGHMWELYQLLERQAYSENCKEYEVFLALSEIPEIKLLIENREGAKDQNGSD